MFTRMTAVVAVWLLAGCGSTPADPQALDGTKYDRTCSTASGCLAVTLHPCGCACAETAISQVSKTQWQNDKNALTCAPITCQADCATVIPVCTAGQCALP